MAKCKECGSRVEWGLLNERWIPLEPAATAAPLAKAYVDEQGVLRADHRERCHILPARLTELARKIPGEVV